MVTNADDAQDFKVMVTDVASPGRASWTEVLAHRVGVRVHDVDAFADHLIISARVEGLDQLLVRRLRDGDDHVIAMPDPVYAVWAGENLDFATTIIRYGYTSLVRPSSAFDYDLETRESTLIKQTPVLGGYDSGQYTRRACGPRPRTARVPCPSHRTDTARRNRRSLRPGSYGSPSIRRSPPSG